MLHIAKVKDFSPLLVSGPKGLISCLTQRQTLHTEENHSNEHASYEIPPLTNIFESPIILSLDSLLKESPKTNCDYQKIACNKVFSSENGISELCVSYFVMERVRKEKREKGREKEKNK